MKRDAHAQAAEQIERALADSGNQVGVLDTAGQIYLAKGEVKKAVDLLRRATGDSADTPEFKTMRLHLAQALAADGKTDEAIKILRAILVKKAGFAERADAKALYRELSREQPPQ